MAQKRIVQNKSQGLALIFPEVKEKHNFSVFDDRTDAKDIPQGMQSPPSALLYHRSTQIKADQKDRISAKAGRNKNESAASKLNEETNVTIAQYLLEKANKSSSSNNRISFNSSRPGSSATSNAGERSARLSNVIPGIRVETSLGGKKRNQNSNNNKDDAKDSSGRKHQELQRVVAVENEKNMKTSRGCDKQSYLLPPKQQSYAMKISDRRTNESSLNSSALVLMDNSFHLSSSSVPFGSGIRNKP